jgi:hypothetical protein
MHIGKEPMPCLHHGRYQAEHHDKGERLGVTISSNLKPGAQSVKAVKIATAVIGQVATAFHCRGRLTFTV